MFPHTDGEGYFIARMRKKMKILAGYTRDELKEYMTELGEKPFRAGQIFRWISKGAGLKR
jgi:hypothetical protein